MNEQSRIVDGEQAKAAMDRFLGPAFDIVETEWRGRLAEIAASEPWKTNKIAKLALALRIAGEVRKQIEAVVADGALALQQVRHKSQIENIPHERRKILGI